MFQFSSRRYRQHQPHSPDQLLASSVTAYSVAVCGIAIVTLLISILINYNNIQIGIPQQLLLNNVSNRSNRIEHLKEY